MQIQSLNGRVNGIIVKQWIKIGHKYRNLTKKIYVHVTIVGDAPYSSVVLVIRIVTFKKQGQLIFYSLLRSQQKD